MYEFRDVNENITLTPLPTEAMQINGVYLETEIEGYQTLYVKGRESLSPELETIEIGTRDGSKRRNKRYPARVITVGYQLIASSSEAFRTAYNSLGALLNVNDAELIFNDEADKFFIGTPTLISEVPSGRNAVTGEIEITCLDPLKYSVVEYEAETSIDDPRSILIDYGGTYKSFPILEADFYNEVESDGTETNVLTGNGDCGYIAFFNEREKIIQLGDPDEENGQAVQGKSETLTNQTFESASSWGTAAKGLWTQNAGVAIPIDSVKTGSVGMKIASYAVPSSPATTSGKILSNAKSDVGSPYIYYSVSLKSYGRTSNGITLQAAITASLASSGSYFLTGLGLKGSIYIGGIWHDVTIKKTSEKWRGKTAHTVNKTITVNNLTASASALTGMKFKVSRTDTNGSAGKLNERACSNLSISTYEASVPETYYLGASDYGSASGKYHGPTIKRTVEASQDFTLTWKQRMSIGNGNNDTLQMGAFYVNLADSSGKVIAGLQILKSQAGKGGSLTFYVNAKIKEKTDIDLSFGNKTLGIGGTSRIIKIGSKVTFEIGSIKKVFTDSSIADIAVTQMTFGFQQYSTVKALTHNGLTWIKFIKNNRDTWHDIPNKFGAGDVVEADCSKGEIRLNDNSSPNLGALGNDWEEFFLTPGLNQIGVAYSNWVTDEYAPVFKVRYREAFL